MDQDVIYADLKFPPRAQQTDVTKAESKAPALKRTPSTWLLNVAILCVLLLGVLILLSILYSQLLARNKQLSEDSEQAQSKMKQVEERFSKLLQWALDTQICTQEVPASKNSESRNVSCSICPFQWVSNNRSCYFFSRTAQEWGQSRAQCQQEKADLVVIADRVEQEFLIKMQMQAEHWIGLTDAKEEGLWTWVDGTTLNSTVSFWSSSQPDNHWHDENCASLTKDQSLRNWNDAECSKRYLYICEKAADTITLGSL